MTATIVDPRLAEALDRAARHSPFLARVAAQEPGLAADLAAGAMPDPGAIWPDDDMPVARRLRIARRRLALTVAVGDLAGVLDLTGVTHRLTNFADAALDSAIRAAIAERTPGAEPAGFAALALGKQGSRELNYSSDIDPILLFDPATLPHRPREEPDEAAVRIGRRVVELLQARDGDGYVLRVDLRLRPSPEATAIVLPVAAATTYYESMALAWERAAFIRARAAAGDVAMGQRFLDSIRSFVWRRSLDFGAIAEIRGISRRIRDHHAQGQLFGPGYDLKRGRGGIREVEFFAQIHQLIHGGRDPSLRAPATRDALSALAARGVIAVGEARDLSDAYTLLRTIEHRLQMVDDRQTAMLPAGAALDNVARLHGLADGDALLDLLRRPVQRVGTIYDSLEPEAAPAALTFDEDGDRLVERWRAGVYPSLRSAAAQAALEAMLPILAGAVAAAPDGRAALVRFDSMLARLPSAVNVLRLIAAQPAVAELLATILSLAPTLAEALARRPALLDPLIDATALQPLAPLPALVAEMTRGERGDDYQARLDRVRALVGEKRFALGTQIVAGARDPLAVSADYGTLAGAAIEAVAAATVAEFARQHGMVPGSELVVLALGRLGGGLLTHASDLDLVYLFTGDYRAESDGPKRLGAVHYYNRLAQRLTAALSVPTPSGALYEVDTRLRPSGTQGPLVVSVEGFARYQRESAWTWEHMALTRGRPIVGSAAARAEVSAIIADVLAGARPRRDILADARAMRAEMARHKPPAGPLDAKLLPGGLVDLEFLVHTTQLIHRTGFDPRLDRAIAVLAGQGLLDPALGAAHDFLTRLLVTLRLVAPDAAEPPPATCALVARAMAMPDWEAVVARLAAVRQEVAQGWAAVAGDGSEA